MSQYASTVLAERSFPPPAAYYQRRTVDPTTPSGTASMPLSPSQSMAYQEETVWPAYYAERTPTQPQPPSSFNTYIVPAGPSSSSSLSYSSSWQSATIPSALTSVGSAELISSFDQSVSSKAIPTTYQGTDDALPVADYPTSPQRTALSHAAPEPEPSCLPSYTFKNDRHRSPSSHASASEYTGWDSPKSSVEELEYPEHSLSTNNQDGYTSQSPQVASRHHSLPTSANTSSSSLQAAVKVEPEDPDSCFILELSGSPAKTGGGMGLSAPAALLAYSRSLLSQSLAPPTEVPLRATQANKEMRTMMGVFRLNPFSMHSLSVNLEDGTGVKDDVDWEDPQSPWSGGEAHPLEEEPVMFEFQLNLNNDEAPALESTPEKRSEISGRIPEGRAGLETWPSGPYAGSTAPSQALPVTNDAQLRSFSPTFSLHQEDYDHERTPYEENDRQALQSRDDEEDQDHEDQDRDQDQRSESWGDIDFTSRSEVDSSSTTTRSVHTPFHDSPQALPTYVDTTYEHHHMHSPSFQPAAWDAVDEQYHENHRFTDPSTSIMPFKPAMAFGASGLRVPRLHTTTSHPYLRKNLQNHHSHPTPQTVSHAHSVPQVQPQGFSLLTQPTHHSYHQSLPAQQSSQTLSPSHENENAFSTVQQHHNQHYQESRVPVNSSSSLMPNHLMSGLHQGQGPPSPSYMRVIRGARNLNFEYERDMSAYSQRSASRVSSGGGKHPSSSEAFNALPSSSAMALHYIQPAGSATMAGNRRWSLPESVAVHSHGGQY